MDREPANHALRFVGISLDCADPHALADFYLALLGGHLLWRTLRSAGIKVPGVTLACQWVEDYHPPAWPGASIVHLDLTAGDQLDGPTDRAVTLGATLADPQPDDRWRVLLDPAGHPFCITPFIPPDESRGD
jgi:hypothetical protein